MNGLIIPLVRRYVRLPVALLGIVGPLLPAAPSALAATGTASAGGVSYFGSVTSKNGSFIRYPDGAVVRITTARILPAADCWHLGKNRDCVFAIATLKNTGQKTITFNGAATLNLYYGINGYTAESDSFMGGPGDKRFPLRCAPGTSVQTSEAWAVPKPGTKHLAVQFDVWVSQGQLTPYMFENVQALLH